MSVREGIYAVVDCVQLIYLIRVISEIPVDYIGGIFDTILVSISLFISLKLDLKRTEGLMHGPNAVDVVDWQTKRMFPLISILVSIGVMAIVLEQYPIYLWGIVVFPFTTIIQLSLMDMIFMEDLTDAIENGEK